jgi:hypothetical protein
VSKQYRSDPSDPHKNLQLARAAAIESYADLEQQLALLFCDLMGSTYQKGSIVFYRIIGSVSRNSILMSLLRNEYGKTYDKFWTSLMKLIRQLDQTRNSIVHWHAWAPQIDETGKPYDDELPAHLSPHGDSEEDALTAEDLWEFVNKAEFVRLQIMMFYLHHLSRPSPETRQSEGNHKAFLLRVTYPPPAGFPGFHFGPIPGTPPQSSEK